MCGICGVVYADPRPVAHDVLTRMNSTLTHRGPDGAGYHTGAGVGLAMRRLSIIDLAGSDQPLYNADQSVALVFNGEIYNYQALRADLQTRGVAFRTEGDGETIAHLYDLHGMATPQHLRGQFAFALWDANERRLLLARDRMGQKPLYYYHDAEKLVFASEIKALLMHPAVPREAIFDDPAVLALYLGYGYIPAPQTAFKHINALPPAALLTWHNGSVQVERYWQLPPINPATSAFDERELIAQLRHHLGEAVRLRLLADVPLGAFLSGGLDSSLIVALMQQASNQTVRTFSIGFADADGFDETPYAERVAQHLGTQHTRFVVEPDALGLLPKLVWHYDQPFADSSAIPTFLVSQLTRQHVTVALTGDGGDELFAGYDRFRALRWFNRLGVVPRPFWQAAARGIAALPEGTGYYNRLKRIGRFVRAAAQPTALAYFDLVRLFDAEQIQQMMGADDAAGADFAAHIRGRLGLAQVLEANMQTYLPDDLLMKADRCSMAASLEARAPFLDHELAAWAVRLPLNAKLNRAHGKYILKKAAEGLLPDDIIYRRKHGFGVPLGRWLRHDMTPVTDALHKLEARGLFQPGAIGRLIAAHRNGERDHGFRLWTLLTLEWWYQTFIDTFEPPTVTHDPTMRTTA